MMRAPVVEIGVNPETVPPMTITETSSRAVTPPMLAASPLAVGISVGNTTPSPELKKDMRPAAIAMIVAAVFGPITDSRPSTMMSMPPEIEMTFIRIPTPRTMMMTFHGIILNAVFSLPHPRTIRTEPTVKPVSPTFQEKNRAPIARAASHAKDSH